MPLKVLGELNEMPATKRRGRKGELAGFVNETLKKNPNKIFNIQANSSTANSLRKDYGVEARSFTTDVPAKDAQGKRKVDKKGRQVYETHIAAVWRGDEKAQEIMKEYAEKVAAKEARKAEKEAKEAATEKKA